LYFAKVEEQFQEKTIEIKFERQNCKVKIGTIMGKKKEKKTVCKYGKNNNQQHGILGER
jgi:hypothetical protein